METFRRQRAAALAEKRRLEQAELDAAQQKLQEMVDANRDKVSERNARILQKEEARRQAQEQKVMEEEMHRLKVLSMLAAEVRTDGRTDFIVLHCMYGSSSSR